MFKARVYDLSEGAAKQLLFGIIQTLSEVGSATRDFFEEILDDASKYDSAKKGG